MATINLDPGEEFAHIHDVVSTTAAVRGEVELTFNGQTIRLTAVPVVIPAHTLHMMVNVGEITAVVRCGYGVGGGRR